MKQLTIIGHIGNDAEIKQVNGWNVINFNVAHSESHKNAEGVKVEKTSWIQCAMWKKEGSSLEIAKYLKKGTQIYAQGEADVSAYIKDGKAIANLRLKIDNLTLLGGNKQQNNNNAAPSAAPVAQQNNTNHTEATAATSEEASDDLPF